jgi:hypothetical protein
MNGSEGQVERVAAADEASGRRLMAGEGAFSPSRCYELIFIGSCLCEAGNREMKRPAAAAVQ